MVARSIARGIARPIATKLVGLSVSAGLPSLPFNAQFVVDDASNYVIDDSGNYVVAYISASIAIAVEDGASSPRSLSAADISYIGYWQIFNSVRATTGSIEFTAVDLGSASASWQSGGIFDDPAGTLRIDLPVHALVGDPDEIEIEITPVSGTVVPPDPIVEV